MTEGSERDDQTRPGPLLATPLDPGRRTPGRRADTCGEAGRVCYAGLMELLYRAQGRPLLRHGRGVFALHTGAQVGAVTRGRVFDRLGRYLGTIEEDCLDYRLAEATRRAKPFNPAVILVPETLDEIEETLTQPR